MRGDSFPGAVMLEFQNSLNRIAPPRHLIYDAAGRAADGAGMADETDWRQWLARHGPAMVLLARQSVGNLDDAHDVVQDAFVSFWKSRRNAEDPLAYLYACVRRQCLQAHRTQSRREARDQAAARPEIDGAADLFHRIEQDERRLAIEAALRSLPAEQRETVIMRLWGGLSFPQIGQVMTVSTDTAASRYRYALAKLRQELAPEHAP
jgi:RNA polymerase sigma-70 factor (ECF subfamily)